MGIRSYSAIITLAIGVNSIVRQLIRLESTTQGHLYLHDNPFTPGGKKQLYKGQPSSPGVDGLPLLQDLGLGCDEHADDRLALLALQLLHDVGQHALAPPPTLQLGHGARGRIHEPSVKRPTNQQKNTILDQRQSWIKDHFLCVFTVPPS